MDIMGTPKPHKHNDHIEKGTIIGHFGNIEIKIMYQHIKKGMTLDWFPHHKSTNRLIYKHVNI